MRGLVEGDAAFQLLLADVAPRADVVRGDGDVEVCHFAYVGTRQDGVSRGWCEHAAAGIREKPYVCVCVFKVTPGCPRF